MIIDRLLVDTGQEMVAPAEDALTVVPPERAALGLVTSAVVLSAFTIATGVLGTWPVVT